METKPIIKLAYEIQQALAKLHRQRYLECLNRLSNLVSQFKELGTESRKLGLSLSRNWLFAAEKYRTRVNRLLNDIPYTISRIKQLADEPKKSPSLIVADRLPAVLLIFCSVATTPLEAVVGLSR